MSRALKDNAGKLAPDLLSPQGGTPADADKARAMIGALDRGQAVANLVAVVNALDGKLGCLGFCPRINTGVPAYEGALKAAGVQHAIHVYSGTDHAFHNDTAGARYNKEAAGLAWSRTMAFLKDALR